MKVSQLRSQTALLIVAIVSSALLTRLLLYMNPGAGGSTILGFHVHHLLIGIVLISIGGVPAILLPSESSLKSVAICVYRSRTRSRSG